MAIATNEWTTFGVRYPQQTSAGIREDVDVITIIDPDETPSLSILPRTTTNGLKHEWLTDSLEATSTAGAFEGDSFSATALTPRTRYANYVQRFRKDFALSQDVILLSQRNGVIGTSSEMNLQAGKKHQEVNRNINARLYSVGSASYGSASGDTTTAPLFANIRNWASANGVNYNQSGAFSTAALYSLQETMWTAGAKPNTIIVSPGVRVDVSRTLLADKGFPTTVNGLGGLTTVQNNDSISGGEYGPVIEYVRTEFGRCAIVMDRWVPQSSSTSLTASESAAWFLIEKEKVRLAWWRPVAPTSVAPQGDFMAAFMLGALTVEVLHPTCVGHAYNVTT